MRPVAFREAERVPEPARHIERVLPVDLAQPGVLAAPGMVHRRGALGDGVEGIFGRIDEAFLEGRIPDGQRRHGLHQPVAQMLGRLVVAAAEGGGAEAGERFAIELEGVVLGRVGEADLHGEIGPGGVPGLEIGGLLGNLRRPESAVFDVARDLVGIGRAAAVAAAVAAPARERADAGAALVAGHVVGVVAIKRRALGIDHAGELQPRAEVEQHRLEAAHARVAGAGRLHHRPADRIGDQIGLADRAVEQRDGVVALQIGGVGQHQVGEGDHLGGIGVRDDDLRDDVVARGVGARQHLHDGAGIHRGIPGHVGHVEEERLDRVGIARHGVRDDHVHHPVRGERRLPGEGLVDAQRSALGVNREILRPARIAELGAVERQAGGDPVVRLRLRGDRAGVGRLEAEAAGGLHRAEDQLQHMQRPAGLEAVGMRRDAAHGVDRDGPAQHGLVAGAAEIGPGPGQGDGAFEGDFGQLGGDAADRGGGDAAALGHCFGRMGRVEPGLCHELEDGLRMGRPEIEGAGEGGPRLGVVPGQGAVAVAVPDQFAAVCVAQEEAVGRRAGIVVHQMRGVGVAHEVVEIDLARRHQHMHEGEDEEPVGAGRDAEPFVGDGVVAGAHRVDRDHLGAARLELAEADLDRVRIVVLGDAEEQQQLCALPVGGAEFPERAAHGVDPGRRHADRAEAAVGGVVRRAELLRPPAGERLALVAAGEKGELLGRGGADRRKPGGGEGEGLLPGDLLEFARAARSLAPERAAEPRRREMLHDPRRALGAEHAAVDRVVPVALDIGDLSVAQMHVDAAAAGAHVAGGLADLVGDLRRGVERCQPCLPCGSSGAMLRGRAAGDKLKPSRGRGNGTWQRDPVRMHSGRARCHLPARRAPDGGARLRAGRALPSSSLWAGQEERASNATAMPLRRASLEKAATAC